MTTTQEKTRVLYLTSAGERTQQNLAEIHSDSVVFIFIRDSIETLWHTEAEYDEMWIDEDHDELKNYNDQIRYSNRIHIRKKRAEERHLHRTWRQ